MISPIRKTSGPLEVVDLLSSSPVKPAPLEVAPVRSTSIHDHFKQFSKPVVASRDETDAVAALPDTVTRRRRRSPLKRYQTAPSTGADDMGSPLLRPSTPRGIDIEAIDLASPESLPSLPRFGAIQRVSEKMREAVALSTMPTPSARPSVKTRASSDTKSAPVYQEIEVLEFSSSMPTPPYEQEQPKDNPAPGRPVISVSALLPVNKRLRDRRTEATVSKVTAAATKSLTSASSTANAGRAHISETVQPSPAIENPSTLQTPVQKVKKRFIQPRDSLPGNWKEVVMEVDLTAPTPKDRRMYRKSGVEELDLTGD
jgi:Holliday junction resolvase YEN1